MFNKKTRNNQMFYQQPYYNPYNMYDDNYDLSRLDTEINE